MAVDREPYTMEPHKFERSVGGKQYCSYCGLLALNNEFTVWAIGKGCNHKDHPSYESRKFQSTKLSFQ